MCERGVDAYEQTGTYAPQIFMLHGEDDFVCCDLRVSAAFCLVRCRTGECKMRHRHS